MSYRNVGNQLHSDAAAVHPGKTKTANIPMRKPKKIAREDIFNVNSTYICPCSGQEGVWWSTFITPFILNLGFDDEWLASRSIHLTPRQTALGNRRMGAW
jgi:hypothetical protein